MWISYILSVLAIIISIVSIYLSYRNEIKVIRFEKRLEIYSNLAYYLVKVYNNHDLIETFYDEIVGLSAKAYFYASDTVNELITEFLESMDQEFEKIEKYKIHNFERNKDYNQFDKLNDVLVEAMKSETDKIKNLSPIAISRLKENYSSHIGKKFIK